METLNYALFPFIRRLTAGVAITLWAAAGSAAAEPEQALSIEGTWIMASAYEILANGTRVTHYGEHPKGLLMVDEDGRYSLQIFRPDRPNFASGVKRQGTPEEYREAVIGSSTHTGRVSMNAATRQLIFDIETASYPNWEGQRQVRDFTYKDDILSYAVPAKASGDGAIAYSIWRKAPSKTGTEAP